MEVVEVAERRGERERVRDPHQRGDLRKKFPTSVGSFVHSVRINRNGRVPLRGISASIQVKNNSAL